MEEKIRAHMEKLFVSAPKTEAARELKEELLQNVLDKYRDLLAEGRTPDEAYLIAIRGIGDISGLIAGLGPGQVSQMAGGTQNPSGSGRFDAFMGDGSGTGFQTGNKPGAASPFETANPSKKLNPTTKTILIIVGAAVALIFIVLMVSKSMIENLRYQRDAADSSIQIAGTDSFPAGKAGSVGEVFDDVTIRKIKVEWVAGDIVIQQGTVASFSVDEPSNLDQGKKTSYEISGDQLIIKEYSESWNFSLGINLNTFNSYPSKTLTLTLPESLKELEIETVSSPVVMEKGVQVEDLDIESVSADVMVRGVSAKDIDLACVSGDLEVYLESAPKEISVENVSGNNTLYVPESIGFTLETESISGDTNVNMSVTNKGDLMIHGDGSCKIKMETVSGEMNVYRFE